MVNTSHTLAQIKLFRSLDLEALRRISLECTWQRVCAKQWVLDAQSEGTNVFFVVRGHVRVVVCSAQRETILRDIHDGELFGELAAIDSQSRSAGILAISNTLLASLSATNFRRAIHDHPDLCDQVLAGLAARIRALANRATEASILNAKHRLWAELLRLARPSPASGPRLLVISPPPTHAELAARVNSHREAVTRELNALERSRLIARHRGAIILADVQRLRQMLAQAIDP